MTRKTTSDSARRAPLRCSAPAWPAPPHSRCRPSSLRRSKSLKVGVYGGYFKDSFDKHIFPDFTKATGIASNRSPSRPARPGWCSSSRPPRPASGAGRRVDDVAGAAMLKGQTTELWAPLDLTQDPELRQPRPHFVNKYPDGARGRRRRRVLVHHAGHQHEGLPGQRPTPGRRSGIRPTRTSSACSRWSPTRSCSRSRPRPSSAAPTSLDTEDGILKALQEARRGEAERAALVSRRGAVRAGAEVGRDPDGPVLSRRHRPGGGGRPSRCARPSRRKAASTTPAPGWCRRPRQGIDEAHVFIDYMSQPTIQALLSRKVGTSPTVKREVARPDAGGVRRGLVGHPADHSALRPLPGEVRLAEPEVDRADRRREPTSVAATVSAFAGSAAVLTRERCDVRPRPRRR